MLTGDRTSGHPVAFSHAGAARALRGRWRSAGRGRWSCTSATRCRAIPATTTASSGTCGGCATCSRHRGSTYFHTSHLFYPFGTTIADHPHTRAAGAGRGDGAEAALDRRRAEPAAAGYVFANMATMYALVWTILSPTESTDPPAHDRARARAAARRDSRGRDLRPVAVPRGASARSFRSDGGVGAAGVRAGAATRGAPRVQPRGDRRRRRSRRHRVHRVLLRRLSMPLHDRVRAGVGVRVEVARPPARRRRRAALRLLFLCGAVAFAAAGASPSCSKAARRSTIGTHTISARTPQNALTLFWLCAFGWMARTWRPRLRVAMGRAIRDAARGGRRGAGGCRRSWSGRRRSSGRRHISSRAAST